MKGQIWVESITDTYYPKLDSGISCSRCVWITQGKVTDTQKTELGPVGTKLVENLLNIPGIQEMFVHYDSVYFPGSFNQNRRKSLRIEIAEAICFALGWEEANLYELQCNNHLETVRPKQPLIVKISSVQGVPGFCEVTAVGGRWKDFPKAQIIEKPVNESDLEPLMHDARLFVQSIMKIPGIREMFIHPEKVSLFLRAGYHWSEVDFEVRKAFKSLNSNTQFV